MAISSIDTYLQHAIQSNLTGLLKNPYIISGVILKDFDPDIRNAFIEQYQITKTGQQKKEIPVQFTFPDTDEFQLSVLIQFKGAKEVPETDHMGSLVGVDDLAADDLEVAKKVPLTVDAAKGLAYLTLPKAALAIDKIAEMSVRTKIDEHNPKIVYIPYMPSLHSGSTYTVFYTPYTTMESTGKAVKSTVSLASGYILEEQFTIDMVSRSMDDLRCLDAIMRTIFIYLRLGADEQVQYQQANLAFKGTDLLSDINTAETAAAGHQIYYREIIVSYRTTYSVKVGAANELTDIIQEPYDYKFGKGKVNE